MEKLTAQQAIEDLGHKAKTASKALLMCHAKEKRNALLAIAKALDTKKQQIIAANNIDLKQSKEKKIPLALLDRLTLTDDRIDAMVQGVRQIAEQQDPIGQINQLSLQPSGFKVGKMRTPIGVIGIVYESRPNVTVDAVAVCIKSGNSCILRGGSEAFHSNKILVEIMQAELAKTPLTENVVQFVNTTDRNAVTAMLEAVGLIDVMIPRGGKGLVQLISNNAKIPVIKHLDGICHVYIDSFAETEMAIDVAFNSKTFRYGICGAMETLLIHKEKLSAVLPDLIKKFQSKGVTLVADEFISQRYGLSRAQDEDWDSEYLDAKLSIKSVESIDEAISHINQHGSQHTDSIITTNLINQNLFLNLVDSASVMVNTATCFADGFQYGLGAEIGISTDKLHVRGPVGVVGLTTEKFIILGNGETRL